MSLRISQLARTTGSTAPTIRYYEKIGLLPPPQRRRTGHRHYGEADVTRVRFIRRCRELGLPIPQVRALIAITHDGTCREARDVAESHLTGIRRRIVELQALEAGLARLLDDAGSLCRGGSAADCRVLRDFSRGDAASP